MEGKAMNGKKLLTAAEIIGKAGEQIEALMEILGDKLIDALTDQEQRIRIKEGIDEVDQEDNDWLIKSWIKNFELYEGRRRNPSRYVAIEAILYNEEEAKIPGWEPALYVMYGFGEDPFQLESFRLANLLEEGCQLEDSRLWRWIDDGEEGWGFALPLVKLNNEKDLSLQVVEPVKKLIAGNKPSEAFPNNSLAFYFEIKNGDILNIKIPNV